MSIDPFKTFTPEDIRYQDAINAPAYQTLPGGGPSYQSFVQTKLQEINYRAPWLSPETQLTLAKANASTAAIDQVGQYASRRQIDTYDQRVRQVGELSGPMRWVYDGVGFAAKTATVVYQKAVPGLAKTAFEEGYAAAKEVGEIGWDVIDDPLKATTRWGVAALDVIPETIQGTAAMVFGQANLDIGGLWNSTSIATLLDAREQNIDIGSGFLMNETLRQEQAKRARLYRGTVNGAAFTIGRGAMATLGLEGGTAYNIGSGFIDAVVTMASFDPTKLVVKGTRLAAQAAKGTVPMLSKADAKSAREVLKNFRDTAHGEAGLSASITGGTVRADQFINWMKNNGSARRLTEALVEETRPSVIMEDVFQFKISNDLAMKIASAKTDNEVISVLTEGWTLGTDALSASIGKYKVHRTPFVMGLRRSKYFTQVPKRQIIVSGDEVQSAEAVKSSVLSMRSAAVPEIEVQTWLNGTPAKDGMPRVMGAVESFTQAATQQDKNASLMAYHGLIARQLKANGISDPIIHDIIYQATGHVDRIKSYMVDRLGTATDNGLIMMFLEQNKKYLDDDVYDLWLEGLGQLNGQIEFAQPMQIVDMLNRVQVLPDVRALRRLTRNRLIQRIMPKDEKGVAMLRKLAITSKKEVREVTKITDEVQWNKANDEFEALSVKSEHYQGEAKRQATSELDDLNETRRSFEKQIEKSVVSGEQKALLFWIEKVQNDLWKPLNLATFGYILRNGMDAQMRMAFGGVNAITHPLDIIHLVTGSKYGTDIRGLDLTKLGGKTADDAEAILTKRGYGARSGSLDAEHEREAYGQMRDGLNVAANRIGFTASDTRVSGAQSGSFPPVNRASGPRNYPSQHHTDGIVQAGQKVIADPLQSIVARGLSAGHDEEKIIDDVMEYLKDTRSEASRSIDAAYGAGIPFYIDGKLKKDIPKNLKRMRKDDPDQYSRILRDHVRHVVYRDVAMKTGGLEDITFMMAHDRVPYFAGRTTRPVTDFVLPGKQKELKIGDLQTITNADGKVIKGVINSISDAPDGTKIAVFVPVGDRAALSRNMRKGGKKGNGDKDARRLIENSPLYDKATEVGLPEYIPREQIEWSIRDIRNMNAMQMRGVNWFFNTANDWSVLTLEKSPTFRVMYYRTISKHMDELSAEEGVKLYQDVLERATSQKKSIREYLGETRTNQPMTRKYESLQNRTNAKGTLTVEELDDYARWSGIQETKELLYDATNRNNLVDAMRVVAPFAAAWQDVMGTWLGFSRTHHVQLARTAQRVYTGLSGADPDQDGRGVFYRDPQSNELMFTFPLSGSLTKLFTGINAPLAGPVKRLSGGMSIYPALGPWAQLAANTFIPDVPDYDKFRKLLTPYGKKGLIDTANPVPIWVKKLYEAGAASTDKLTNTYGQTYIETLRALSTNPKYDLSNPEDQLELFADAKFKARLLTIMRATSQFTGPTAGTLEFKIPTEQGDQYISELIKEFRGFQEEDYDTAVLRFLNLYGDELMLYATSKSKAQNKGLETSVEFDAWARNNEDLIKLYPDLATYFAPKGSDFEFSVWARQQRNLQRIPLTDQQLVAEAQNRLGSTKYRAARQQFGAFPSDEQIEKLKNYRVFLNQKLPGFPVNVEFKVNELKNDLVTLEKMLDNPRFDDSPMRSALVTYLNARNSFLAQVGGKTFQSKKANRVRAQLYQIGESLALRNPEFDRIWSRLLVSEVDQ